MIYKLKPMQLKPHCKCRQQHVKAFQQLMASRAVHAHTQLADMLLSDMLLSSFSVMLGRCQCCRAT